MEWDCRLRTKQIRMKSAETSSASVRRVLSVILIVIISWSCNCDAFYLDCNEVQNAGHCDCSKLDAYTIDCPGQRSLSPIQLKLFSTGSPTQAFLEVTCNPSSFSSQIGFHWNQIQGVDLGVNKIAAQITKLSLIRCPAETEGLRGLLSRINVTNKDIKRFSLQFSSGPKLPQDFLSDFSSLETLNLSHNDELEELPNLSKLTNLEELNVRSSKIHSLAADSFKFNTKLKRAFLPYNRIEQIPGKVFPASLEALNLSGNKFRSLSNDTFANLHGLKYLFLEDVSFVNASPECFDNLPSLQQLFLNKAQFKVFPTLKNLPNLVNLSINSIRLEQQPLALRNLPSLAQVKAAGSKLTLLPVLESVPNLKRFDLRMNILEELTEAFFSNFSPVEIDLSDNRIRQLVELKCPLLEKLLLNKNRLQKLTLHHFKHLMRLKQLDVSDNQIQEIEYNTFESQGELLWLDLSRNNISFNSPFKDILVFDGLGDFAANSFINKCTKLQYIDLAYNNFQRIFDDWKNVFTTLEHLDLSHNKLQSLNVVDLQFITTRNLQLNLTHNEITKLDFSNHWIFEENDQSVDVYLDGNPIDCDCFAYLVKTLVLKSHRMHINKLFCANPPFLKNLPLQQVQNNDLLCKLDPVNCPIAQCSCWTRPVDTTIVVNCSNLELTKMPKFELKDTNTLQQWRFALDFSSNNITDVDNEYISGLPATVNSVSLTNNMLTSIPFLSKMKESSHLNFSLSHNPFDCDRCSDFVTIWGTQASRIADSDNITCSEIRAGGHFYTLTVQSLPDLLDTCNTVDTAGIRILVICVIVFGVLCLIMIVLMVRYSWVVKALIYSSGWGWLLFWDKAPDEDGDQEKLYDAFVSYSHKDEDWVVDELVKKLEGEEGYKLCLHFRDWTIGDWIPDQIVRSVDQSKRTVVILSKHFVESVWSRLEFKAAHAQALSRGSNRVILVLLEDELKDNEVQDEDLKVYMKMNTYLKKNDPWFWHKLKYALPHRRSQTDNQNIIKQKQHKEQAKELDRIRAKLEEVV